MKRRTEVEVFSTARRPNWTRLGTLPIRIVGSASRAGSVAMILEGSQLNCASNQFNSEVVLAIAELCVGRHGTQYALSPCSALRTSELKCTGMASADIGEFSFRRLGGSM